MAAHSSRSTLAPPNVPEAPTQHEDLATKPAAQIAFRDTYPSGYGPVRAVMGTYTKRAQEYRDLYHRLHAEVDGPLDRVRRAVTDQGSDAVIVKTSDHGDLLGAHGGLHQKWFNLYDEATRVPFSIALVGSSATTGAAINDAPTSHIDIIPTLLAAAGIEETAAADRLREDFTEVHPLPGANLMPVVVDPPAADRDRAVYLMTNDNMLEGDTGASGLARRLKRTTKPPLPLRISTPAHVASNFEGPCPPPRRHVVETGRACSMTRRRGPNLACGTSPPAAGLARTPIEATRCPTSGSSMT